MDKFLEDISTLKKKAHFLGSTSEFKKSKALIDYCVEHGLIANISSPTQLNLDYFDEYHKHLLRLTKEYLAKHRKVKDWSSLISQRDTRKVSKILHEFGIRGVCFEEVAKETVNEPEITITDLWEMAIVHKGFKGSETAFKRWLQENWGSVAEYCLEKGLPINAQRWDTPETAIRVAKKLGSLDAVKAQSKSLYNYLEENNLLNKVQFDEPKLELLFHSLLSSLWSDQPEKAAAVLDRWILPPIPENYEFSDIKPTAHKVAKLLSPEELGLLYFDIGTEMDADGDPSEREKAAHEILDTMWRSKMIPYAEQVIRFHGNGGDFSPKSVLEATGYLLFEAISVDGGVFVEEIQVLREGLKNWEGRSARRVLAAVNFCMTATKTQSIFQLESLLRSSMDRQKPIQECCEYLAKHTDLKTQEMLLDLIERIARADGRLVPKEKELLEHLRKAWKVKKAA